MCIQNLSYSTQTCIRFNVQTKETGQKIRMISISRPGHIPTNQEFVFDMHQRMRSPRLVIKPFEPIFYHLLIIFTYIIFVNFYKPSFQTKERTLIPPPAQHKRYFFQPEGEKPIILPRDSSTCLSKKYSSVFASTQLGLTSIHY